ncbi:MAG: hypothetical protein MJB14_04520 [Spirochaetes bacterium]|nr:hypothetical protein [Spirochaetota bacterium]
MNKSFLPTLLILLLFLLSTSCKHKSILSDKKYDRPKAFSVSLDFSEDIIINKKYKVANSDQSTDIVEDHAKPLEDLNTVNDLTSDHTFDQTSDQISQKHNELVTENSTKNEKKKAQYVLDKTQIEYYKAYKNYLADSFTNLMGQTLLDNKIDIPVYYGNDGDESSDINIKITILEYQEGEFNYIKNIPTELLIRYEIDLINYQEKIKKKKKYKLVPDITKPLEQHRVQLIAKEMVLDIFALFFKTKEKTIKIKTEKKG